MKREEWERVKETIDSCFREYGDVNLDLSNYVAKFKNKKIVFRVIEEDLKLE